MKAKQTEELNMLEEEMSKRKPHFVLVILRLAYMNSLAVHHTTSSRPFPLPVLLCFSYANSAALNCPPWEQMHISIFIFLL